MGVAEEQIISIALDDDINEKYKVPEELSAYVRSRIIDPDKAYYVLLDEVQYAIFRKELKSPDAPVKLYSVLNGLLRLKNVDVYVTGSNSKMCFPSLQRSMFLCWVAYERHQNCEYPG